MDTTKTVKRSVKCQGDGCGGRTYEATHDDDWNTTWTCCCCGTVTVRFQRRTAKRDRQQARMAATLNRLGFDL